MASTAEALILSRSGRWIRFRRDYPLSILLCLLVAVALAVVALFAAAIAPMDPVEQSLLARLRPPLWFENGRWPYLLGTDELGRDVLSRCIHGLRMTLGIATLGVLIGVLLGSGLGLLSGLGGRSMDAAVMMLVDIQLAVPFLLIALFAIALFGTDLNVLIGVVGVAYWEQYARIVRGQVLMVRALPFVEASRAAGASTAWIAFRHVLPNVASPIIVYLALNYSNIVLLESSLSFLGLGVQPPTASLGAMIGQGRDYMTSAPWVVLCPALLIITIALVVSLLGDWLRDRLDVRLGP